MNYRNDRRICACHSAFLYAIIKAIIGTGLAGLSAVLTILGASMIVLNYREIIAGRLA